MSNTSDYKKFFKGKKITLMGLGLLGRGIGDAAFLASCAAELIVTDKKTAAQLASSVEQLKKYKNIQFVLGEHRFEDFKNRDMIIRGADVPPDSLYIQEAEKNKVPVKMSTSLFAELSPATIVGITGTRGKSTVTQLIFEVLKLAYKGKKQKVYLGGNVRGVSTLAMLPKVRKGDIVVLELDSWQLQGFGEAKLSPHVAVFTTLMQDHMNYYKNSMSRYFRDKANIYKYQKPEDILIVGKQVASRIKKTTGKKIVVDDQLVPENWKIQILGIHNRYNIALGIAATRSLGVSEKNIKKAVEAYKGVEGRLELIKTRRNKVKIYNDNNSTTPDALIAGLKAVGKYRNVVLIMGGADKKIPMKAIFPELIKYTKGIILLPGTGTDALLSTPSFKKFQCTLVKDMAEAVDTASKLAIQGDIILFSPGFSSFGLFKNEYDRNDQFVELVKKLK